jgi:hypothetical protein
VSPTKKTAKIKAITCKENPAGNLGQIILSYPVKLAILSKFAYDKVIEALVGTASDSSGAEAFEGGSRDLIWNACSKSSVLSIKDTLKEHGITNIKVRFYPLTKD